MDVMKSFGAVLFIVALASPAVGQPPAAPGPGGGQAQPPEVSAGEIQRWFEAYVLVQAQDALQLSDAQYGRFATRLKQLQESRRLHQQRRNLILADLRRLTAGQAGTADESALRDRLKALRDEEDRGAVDLRKAYESLDEILDVRQQARFRLFEDRMEQRKLELLMRARLNARTGARSRRGGGS